MIVKEILIWISVVRSLSILPTILSLSCVDDRGRSIDYFIGYKIPKLEKSADNLIQKGYRYLYIGPDSGSAWTQSKHSIAEENSILGATLRPILTNNQKYNLVVYNDQKPPIRTRGTSTRAHAKGIVAIYGTKGFWLIHTIPQFPIIDSKYEYPKRSLNNGQIFMCISITIDDVGTIESIGKHLLLMQPNIYQLNLTDSFTRKFPLFKDLNDRKKGSTRSTQIVDSIHSIKRKQFIIFSKNKRYNQDLYSGLIAPYFNEDFLAQTWRNGAGEMLNSNCKDNHKVMNIESVKIDDSTKWQYREDHAKWAISSQKSGNRIICIADINRMRSQFSRSGGSVCLKDSNMWKSFHSIINDVEGCPLNNFSRLSPLDWIQSLSGRVWRKIEESTQKCRIKS
ncbi:Casein kinase II subunit alpha [Sarcoptes scabiei]|nr:Casein kinase II subunit alpha [Sarcoptes scabiei]